MQTSRTKAFLLARTPFASCLRDSKSADSFVVAGSRALVTKSWRAWPLAVVRSLSGGCYIRRSVAAAKSERTVLRRWPCARREPREVNPPLLVTRVGGLVDIVARERSNMGCSKSGIAAETKLSERAARRT